MVAQVVIPFTPSAVANFSFQATLDGAQYNCVCTFNSYGQRYYLSIYDLAQNLVLSRPVAASPDTYNLSLTLGYFDTSIIFRDSNQSFEIPGLPITKVLSRPPGPPPPAPPGPPGPPPPQPPDPYFADVVLLLHGEGTDGSTTIVDSSSYDHTLTQSGTVSVDTAQGEFPGGSVDFSSGHLVGTGAKFDFNNDSFTFEAWIRTPSLSAEQSIFGSDTSDDSQGSFTLYIVTNGQLVFFTANEFGNHPIGVGTPPAAIVTDEWMFVSLTQSASSLTADTYIHVNGMLLGSNSGAYNGSFGFLIKAGDYQSRQPFPGWMQEYRVTVGVARYTAANYAVPTQRFPNY